MNLVGLELGPGSTRPGYAHLERQLGLELGTSGWGGTLYELRPGERICPYHWHVAEEEWLLVVDGEPTLRTPDAEQRLHRWDVAVFTRGSDGAHEVRNDSDDAVRVLMLSTVSRLEICVYPDSGKMDAAWTDAEGREHLLRNRPEQNVDLYDGEA